MTQADFLDGLVPRARVVWELGTSSRWNAYSLWLEVSRPGEEEWKENESCAVLRDSSLPRGCPSVILELPARLSFLHKSALSKFLTAWQPCVFLESTASPVFLFLWIPAGRHSSQCPARLPECFLWSHHLGRGAHCPLFC